MHDALKRRHTRGPDWFSRIVVAAFCVAALVMIGYIGWSVTARLVVPRLVAGFTEAQPRTFAAPAMPEAEVEMLEERVEHFTNAVKDNAPQEPLEISEVELNALLRKAWEDEVENGGVRVRIEQDRLVADLSVPLDGLAGTTWWRLADRYLTGTATLDVALEGGRLDLKLASFVIDGDPVPQWILDALDADAQLRKLANDPDVREVTRNLARVELTRGRIVLEPAQAATVAGTLP